MNGLGFLAPPVPFCGFVVRVRGPGPSPGLVQVRPQVRVRPLVRVLPWSESCLVRVLPGPSPARSESVPSSVRVRRLVLGPNPSLLLVPDFSPAFWNWK